MKLVHVHDRKWVKQPEFNTWELCGNTLLSNDGLKVSNEHTCMHTFVHTCARGVSFKTDRRRETIMFRFQIDACQVSPFTLLFLNQNLCSHLILWHQVPLREQRLSTCCHVHVPDVDFLQATPL